MVTLEEIQSAYYMVAATGVLVAAIYYIMNLRNAEREKRRQMIMQKLPKFSKEYYEDYVTVRWTDFDNQEEYNKKFSRNPEFVSKMWHILNMYNILGVLYQENLMSLEDICKLYSPAWIIRVFERFQFVVIDARSSNREDPSHPELFAPLEHLYFALKKKYPNIPGWLEVREQENKELTIR